MSQAGSRAAEPLLVVDRVAKFYGHKLVFKEVSLEVRPGEVWLVVGPNGAGKSTLVGVMAGLVRPDAGSLPRRPGPGRIGYLGHASFLYPRLSALANLAFWAGMHGKSTAQDELMAHLERVGLARVAHEPAETFSRGMTQRLALARVFIQEPDLLVLDEPTTGLDTHSQAMLDAEVRAARDRGAAVVWVSHNVARDLALAHGVLALEGGRSVYRGPAADYPVPEAAC